ncbi:hypothetical protein [Streptomyces aureocirculatus]|uniref:hypothetical protein n=1 Tax=Streptomyces aureocirculatus TaxID=67275 RepID=UPI001CEC2F19|nr:hypothetical protein [Streptomyces aureocirculatus]
MAPIPEKGDKRVAHSRGVGEVEPVLPAPVLVGAHGYVDAYVSPAVALADEALPVVEGHHGAGGGQGGEAGMTDVGVVEAGLDEGDAGVAGCGVRQRAAHLGPGAVGADDEIGVGSGAVGEVQSVDAVAEGFDAGETVGPARVIAEESGLPADGPACTALAHFALEAPVPPRTQTVSEITSRRANSAAQEAGDPLT